MAGVIPGFDPDEFRDAIRFAMTMGAPEVVDQRATFYFPKPRTATGPTDASGVPYSPTDTVTEQPAAQDPITATCSVEDAAGNPTETGIGTFGDAIVVTLLDEEYELVLGFEFVAYQGVRWDYEKELLAGGLGSVGVHRLLCVGEGRR